MENLRQRLSERLFDDGNTGNIGIGTDSPSAKLHIGDGSSYDDKINFTIESMTSNKIIFSGIDNLDTEYNPADDPYYKNEDLYIPNEINCGS